jgi:hypothetical protein
VSHYDYTDTLKTCPKNGTKRKDVLNLKSSFKKLEIEKIMDLLFHAKLNSNVCRDID